MRGSFLIAVFWCLAQAASLVAAAPAHAETNAQPEAAGTAPAKKGMPWESQPASQPSAAEPEVVPPASSAAPSTPSDAGSDVASPAETVQLVPPNPIVAIIRAKLAEPGTAEGTEADDISALQAFYGTWSGAPLWTTEMGFSARGQAALFEIAKADDWGLDAKDFALPESGALTASDEAQALAEIKLDLAILKYARFARGGRHDPSEISELLDQTPPLREPQAVIAEIGVADAPDAYLRSLHPRHEQFVRLRRALLAARDKDGEDAKADGTDIKRLILNMERWRWMPEELGSLYVWLNTPEFMLYVVKDGKTVFRDKTLVGTIGYATPVFSADMQTIVFNPDWVAPPSVLQDKLLPALRRKSYNILKSNKLRVSYQGKLIDPTKVDWNRVNIHSFTFSQKSGPKNVLGKAKFLYPNKHIVYMHDTLPYRQKVFKEENRAIGYGCVRMQKPKAFAELLLAEDRDWPASKVADLWDKGVNSPVTLDAPPPVHTTYFTAVVDDKGKIETHPDLYGLDRALAIALFGDAQGFPEPPPEPEPKRPSGTVASASARNTGGGGGFSNSLGFLDD
ncbi:MAG TPA: L,D-transpeptidase family protein [Methyloceanibacter sp.]|nr:L,D-transpeptidase family protein [Methyloceanibacter sp.]